VKLTLPRRPDRGEVRQDLAPVPAPDAVEVTARHLVVGDQYAASFAVTGYPAEVHAGWLEPLTTYPGRLDIALHITPIDPTTAATKLRRQRARLESGRRSDAERGRLSDPEAEAAAQDATDLAYRLARGEGRLFRVGLYLTVYAGSEQALAREVAAVRALASSLLVTTAPTTFRQLSGWAACLPLGIDTVGATRTFDTAALSAAFPFTSPDLAPTDPTDTATPTTGVLYGVNAASSGLVLWDRWSQDNHNSITLARSGAGKSYFTKLDVLRSLYTGVQVFVIDPEDEYTRLARAVGGTVLSLGVDGVRLNPFDLPRHAAAGAGAAGANALLRRSLFIHTFIQVLLGRVLSAGERAVLDKAVLAAYAGRGITTEPRTWARPAPVLADLVGVLHRMDTGAELAEQLEPFTVGSWAGLFDGPTSTEPTGHLVSISLRELPDELRTVGTLLVLDAIWRQVTSPERRRRLVVVDEAWLLMRDPEGARFLLRMAKAARKCWAGLAVITQDAADVLGSDLGAAIVANSATQVLLRQAPQALDAVTKAFRLSEGEAALIASATQGLGLLAAGSARVSFQVIASDTEHQLASSSPADLVEDEDDGYFADPPDPGTAAVSGQDDPTAYSMIDDPNGDLL
jgi:type IV secretory pathway VirB4 component